MAFSITKDALSNFLDISLDYGDLHGKVITYEHTTDMHIRIVWHVYRSVGHDFALRDIIFTGEKKIPYYDVHGLWGKRVNINDFQYTLFNEYYTPVLDMVRTAMFCAVLEKLHAAHNCGI